MAGTRRIHATVTGRVQNVGFRNWVMNRAEAQGLSGWVRNSPDTRRVELEVQGDATAVDDLARALHEGPPGARVTGLSIEERVIDASDFEFHVR